LILELDKHQRDCQMDENVAGKRRRRLWIAGSKEYAEKSSMLLQCYFDCFSAKQGKINPLEKKWALIMKCKQPAQR